MERDPSQFENLFENVRREVDPEKLKRFLRGFAIVVGLLVIFLVASSSLGPATEYLWFVYDARHPGGPSAPVIRPAAFYSGSRSLPDGGSSTAAFGSPST